MIYLIGENLDLQGTRYHIIGSFKLPVEDWQLTRMSKTVNEVKNKADNSNSQSQNLKQFVKNLH